MINNIYTYSISTKRQVGNEQGFQSWRNESATLIPLSTTLFSKWKAITTISRDVDEVDCQS